MWRAVLLVSVISGCGTAARKPGPAEPTTWRHFVAADSSADGPAPPRIAEPPPSEADTLRDAELARLDAPQAPVPPPRPTDPAIVAAMAALDPTEYVRWPLTPNTHPVLEPGFAVADALAEPGVTWLDLCAMGAQNRRTSGRSDELAYLRAWCAVAKRDSATAIEQLAPLRYSAVHGIASVVRTDIANIAVDAGDASTTARLLSKTQLDDVAIYDLVAASYAEVGKTADAIEINNRAIAANDVRHPDDRCMRIAREVLLAPPKELPWRTERVAETGCKRLFHELRCWTDTTLCDAYLIDRGIPAASFVHGDVYSQRPAANADAKAWLRYASLTANYAGDSARDETLDALETGVRAAKCEYAQLGELITFARNVRLSDDVKPRLDRIVLTPEALCH